MYLKIVHLLFILTPASLLSQTVKIDPSFYRSATDIPGYKLLFSDEFDSLDRTVWDLSAPGNDGTPYDDPDFAAKSNHVPANPSNVLTPVDGILKIRVRQGEERDMAAYSSGEIKTFNNHSWSNQPPPYRNWTMIPGQYLEARIKIPYCPGINAALWLYGITGTPDDPDRRFFEVDIIESFGEKPTRFWTNIHYGKAYRDKSHRSQGREIKVKNTQNQKVILKDIWLTFGLEYTETAVKMYLNGSHYNTYKLYPDSKRKKHRYLKSLPAFLRLGTGKTSVERTTPDACTDFPVFLEVDYIRLYTIDTLPAIHFLHDYNNISVSASKGRQNSGFNMQLNYIPGVKYRVEDNELFDITHNKNYITACQCEQWWVSPKEGTRTGPATISVMAEFPDGRLEKLEARVNIVE